MINRNAAAILLASLSLAACDAELGPAREKAPQAVGAPAAGKAEESRLSIKVPGLEMSVDMPVEVAADRQGELLYPGAKLGGLHVEGGKAANEGGLELRFTSPDAPDKVAAWYRAPERARHFTVSDIKQEGPALLLSGTRKDDGGALTLRLVPQGGGTEGRLNLVGGG